MRNALYRPAPDVWDGMAVSPDEFDALPRPSGWKYERWDGRLRLEPDWRHEVARFVGPVPEAGATTDIAVGPVTPVDAEALLDVADEAFTCGSDFFNFPPDVRRRQLQEAVEDALALEPVWVRRAHRVVRATDGEAVGLLLLREVEGGVCLNTVGVRPRWQRRGLAAALLRAALAALPDGVEVRSEWLVANRESAAWHRRVGFETVETSVSKRSRLMARWWRGRTPLRDRFATEDGLRELERAEQDGCAPDPFAFTRPVHRRPRGVG